MTTKQSGSGVDLDRLAKEPLDESGSAGTIKEHSLNRTGGDAAQAAGASPEELARESVERDPYREGSADLGGSDVRQPRPERNPLEAREYEARFQREKARHPAEQPPPEKDSR